jgi:twitching motility two-component system response regulator PilG
LVNRNYLNSNQKTILIRELTQDALESLLWLTNGKFEWNSVNPLEFLNRRSTFDENPLELAPVLASLQIRLQKWQKLGPLITSPYQRPLCANPSLLQKKVPSGNLSPIILKKLVSLMRGLTIRQLGLFLKQDDLKLTELLFPYVQQQIIQLQSPKSPFDRLPPIPTVQPSSQLSGVKLNSVIPSTTVTSLKSAPTSSPVNSSNVSLSPSKSVIQERESQQKIYRIICIDDSPTMLDIIKNYLGNEKYQILTIENPMQSVAYLFDSKPDLILMDFSMPGINGNRLCQILKSSSVFQNVPIIMISANAKMLDKEKIQAAGATDFLAKPFTQESLLAMVNNYLEKAC